MDGVRQGNPSSSSAGPAHQPPAPAPVESRQRNFPKVRFWTQASFQAWISDARRIGISEAEAGGSLQSAYLESFDGSRTPSDRQSAMFSHARAIWDAWSKEAGALRDFAGFSRPRTVDFRYEMERKFEELQLCEGHWKADQIWFDGYESWLDHKRTFMELDTGKSKKRALVAVKDENRDEDSRQPTKKRRADGPSLSTDYSKALSSRPESTVCKLTVFTNVLTKNFTRTQLYRSLRLSCNCNICLL